MPGVGFETRLEKSEEYGQLLVRLETMPLNATHCNTLQHTATHCNTLHHIAAHIVVGKSEEEERLLARLEIALARVGEADEFVDVLQEKVCCSV